MLLLSSSTAAGRLVECVQGEFPRRHGGTCPAPLALAVPAPRRDEIDELEALFDDEQRQLQELEEHFQKARPTSPLSRRSPSSRTARATALVLARSD